MRKKLKKDLKEDLKCTESADNSEYQDFVPILEDFHAKCKLVNVNQNENSNSKIDLKNLLKDASNLTEQITNRFKIENSMFQNLEAFEKSINIENSEFVNNQKNQIKPGKLKFGKRQKLKLNKKLNIILGKIRRLEKRRRSGSR